MKINLAQVKKIGLSAALKQNAYSAVSLFLLCVYVYICSLTILFIVRSVRASFDINEKEIANQFVSFDITGYEKLPPRFRLENRK